jgi:hypothetical protein
VAVGPCLGDQVGADRRAGAGPVLDQNRLAETLRQALAERARHEVGGAAWRKGDDYRDRLGRELLGLSHGARGGGGGDKPKAQHGQGTG